jgi:hypothetical protein
MYAVLVDFKDMLVADRPGGGTQKMIEAAKMAKT